MNSQRLGEVAGAEKQGDLHHALMHQVDQTADGRDRTDYRDAQSNIGDLTDRGKCQPTLQVILE